jgi:hypothetical protein
LPRRRIGDELDADTSGNLTEECRFRRLEMNGSGGIASRKGLASGYYPHAVTEARRSASKVGGSTQTA